MSRLGDSLVLPLLTALCRCTERRVELDEVLTSVLEALAHHLGIFRGTISLLDRDTREIRIDAGYGLTEAQRKAGRFAIGEGMTGQVIAEGRAAVIPRIADAEGLVNPTGSARVGEAAFISVPLGLQDEVLGALGVDVLAAPHELPALKDLLTVVAAMIAQTAARRRAERELEAMGSPQEVAPRIVTRAKSMRPVLEAIRQVADSDATILVRGESGVGKELVAEAIHHASPREKKPFVRVNCAALPETVLASELFGHEQGAFTGAVARRLGRFELAHRGTIFLDEIGDLSLKTQAVLLRILQEGTLQRVGGMADIHVDVRVIAATHRNLENLIASGEFREDLYYRLNVFPIHVPPLRERPTDILLLADAFLERYGAKNGKAVCRISSRAIDMLVAYHWPGNVRELENCIERAVLLSIDGVIHGHHLPPTLQTGDGQSARVADLEGALAALERDLVEDALKSARGNMAEAARALGLTERKMGLRVKKHGINARRFRSSYVPRAIGDDAAKRSRVMRGG